jgi:hypothetical protein
MYVCMYVCMYVSCGHYSGLKERVTGGWRKLYSEELLNLYSYDYLTKSME